MPTACRGANLASSSSSEAEALPEWDLGDLFAGINDPEIDRTFEAAEAEAGSIEKAGRGRLADLSGDALAKLIERYEGLEDQLGRVISYAQLLHAANLDDPEIGRFFQSVRERTNAIERRLLFVTLELNRIDDASLESKLEAASPLQRFRPWLRTVRDFRPHQLDDAIEEILHEKSVTGRGAWIRLFDETMAALRFRVDERDLTSAQVFDLLTEKDRATREKAGRAISDVLERNQRLLALITNTLAKDKAIEDGWRRFERPISARDLSNQVEDQVVDALIEAVRDAYPRLSHRYYAIKARWMGLEKLAYWDRNAPLPEDPDKRVAFEDAKVIVLDAYRRFSRPMAELTERFFTDRWIDARLRPGKDAGAFCHPTVPSAHPYVLMNYQGRARDVMTLAHELGHGVHQMLAAGQGPLMAGTPLTLAETASVFGEQLTFRSLLENEPDPAQRRVLLAGKIEDALNTVVRQIAFVDFERRVHDARKSQEVTAGELGDIWLTVQRESLGPAFEFAPEYRVFWSYIPHFVHVPFYVYAYAFGDCLVNSLYAVYEGEPDGFEGRYLDLLRAGGTLRHRELLAPFGLDAADPGFWSKGLSMIEAMIDQLNSEMVV